MSIPQSPQHKSPKLERKYVILIVIVVLIVVWGIGSRVWASIELRKNTDEQAVPVVSVSKAPQGPVAEEVVLPGTVESWHEAPIYARTNGYLKDWKTDIGARVKAGDLMAEIDTPEIDSQLQQAKADLATAEANNQLAQLTANRWRALLKTDSVSKQDADEKFGDADAKAALVRAAQANVDRLNDLESFKRVVAPFDGIVTARTTDVGALISSGSTTGQILFRVAQTNSLRVYVQVPQTYVNAITPGMVSNVSFPEHPDKLYPTKLYHSADAMEPVARTLLIQFLLDNADGALLPGGYVDVHLKLPENKNAVRVPVSALLFRGQGMQVATIDNDDKVTLKNVTPGRDFGTQVEIVAGITAGESIITNPPDSLETGDKVRVASAEEEKSGKDEKSVKKDDIKEKKQEEKDEKKYDKKDNKENDKKDEKGS